MKTTERGGLPCRTLAIANRAKALSASGDYRFCKDKSDNCSLSDRTRASDESTTVPLRALVVEAERLAVT